ncbi:hypothetical protein [Malacoplasma iowae]|uniref:hypothetical protein n=1 Tax=Malacoplasma iowae TaxID=2116 RepID=UPI00387391B2|nr:hypothetical protein QX179_05225 [Malacoplasma iowae]
MVRTTRSKNSLKTGQTVYVNKDEINSNNSKVDKRLYRNVREGKYPSGIFPFVIIWIIFVACILIYCLTLNPVREVDSEGKFTGVVNYVPRKWQDGLWISSGITLCLNFFWLISRQNFNANVRYGMRRISHKMRFDYLKFNEPRNDNDYSINRVTNIDEYKEYLSERTLRTRLLFWISFGLHSLLFIISTIVAIFVK